MHFFDRMNGAPRVSVLPETELEVNGIRQFSPPGSPAFTF